MNILHISPNFNYSCGVSKHVYLLIKELSNRKDVKLFFLSNGGDSLERLYKLNVKTGLYNYEKGKIRALKFLSNLRYLKKYCLDNQIDIIHTHHRYPELLSVIVSRLLKIKTITTVHSFVTGWKILSFRSNIIIAVSKAVKTYLINKYRIKKSKIIQMYNFVEPFKILDKESIISKKHEYGINTDEKILLFVGRVGYDKGFDILIEAFNRVIVNTRVKLLVVGNIEVEELSHHLNNDKFIKYFEPREDIYDLYNMADIIVLPSRIDPFPFVLLETGLAKKSFIGGRTGGIEEFIENDVNGILVTPGSIEELTVAIMNQINNQDKASQLGNNLFEKVNRLNKAEEYCENLLSIYKELLFDNSPKV